MKERFIIISNNSRSMFWSVYESDTEEIAGLFSSVTGPGVSGTSTTQPSLDDLIKALQHSTLKNAPSVVYDSAHPTDLFFSLEGDWDCDVFPFEITFNEQADLNKLEAATNIGGVLELVGREDVA